MNSDENLKDESLLRCTIKKSISVLTKVVRYVLYAAVITIAIAGLGYVGYIGLPVIIGICSALVASLISLLALIPWYVYVIVGIILAIPVYSFLWCIARDLTDEDWGSEAANNAAVAFAAAFAFALAFAAAFALALAVALAAAFAVALTAAFAVALAFAFAAAVDPVDKTTRWYYIFRFVGAVWHHYKQKKIKEETK